MEAKVIQLSLFPDMLVIWLGLFVLFALFLAAILHWKISRHWSLLVLAIAPLCLLLGQVVTSLPLLGGAWIFGIAFGSQQAFNTLYTIAKYVQWAGLILGGIGAIGSICRAVKLGRREKRKVQDSVSVLATDH